MDEAYRQGKLFIVNLVITRIDQGATLKEIRASLSEFKDTREDKPEALAELQAAVEAQVAVVTRGVKA